MYFRKYWSLMINERTKQSKANQFILLEEGEKSVASGGIRSHDTLLSRLNALPTKLLS